MVEAVSISGQLGMVGSIMTPVQLTAMPPAFTPLRSGQRTRQVPRLTTMNRVLQRWP